MAFLKKLASPFKGKAAREEEKMNIAAFKRQEEERLAAARATLQSGRRESHSMSSLSSQAQRLQGSLMPNTSGHLSNSSLAAPRRQASDGNLSYHSGAGRQGEVLPKSTTWKRLKETFRFKPPSPRKGEVTAAEAQGLQAQPSLGRLSSSRPPSILAPAGPLATNLQRQGSGPFPSPSQNMPAQQAPPLQQQPSARFPTPWQQPPPPQPLQGPQVLQKPPRANSSPRQGSTSSSLGTQPQGVLTLQQKNLMQQPAVPQGLPQQPVVPQLQSLPQQSLPAAPSTSSSPAASQALQATQAQLRELQQKLSIKESELQEVGRLKQSLAQERSAAVEWRERWNAQNFKLNLMVNMLALNLAEKEHPQGGGPSMVGMLGEPAAKLGVAV